MLKLLILLSIFIFGVYSNSNLLKKFHQSDYIAKFTRLEAISYDKEFLNDVTVKTFKFNRSTTAFNVTWNAKIDFGRKMEFVFKARKFLSNEYRRITPSFQLNFCQIMDYNVVGIKNAGSCGNLTSCNLLKDVSYHVCNFVPDGAHMPPFLLNGQFLLDIHAIYLHHEIAIVHCYFEVDRVVPIPKK